MSGYVSLFITLGLLPRVREKTAVNIKYELNFVVANRLWNRRVLFLLWLSIKNIKIHRIDHLCPLSVQLFSLSGQLVFLSVQFSGIQYIRIFVPITIIHL